jgi:hypothetical protein
MSLKKTIYLALKAKITAIKETPSSDPTIKTCRLFNNQFAKLSEEATFEMPCVFIEYSQLDYTTKGQGVQEAEARIRFHIGYNSLKTEDLDLLDLLESFHKEIQGLTDQENFSPLNRVFEAQDIDHDQISVWVTDYETLILDSTAHTQNKLKEVTINELEITVDAESPFLKQK